ncbi:MAG: helix-turn-helix transcriptional regulator [Deltaproteobacteria bacterium]|nr:helix-turn-helix transcriptional regulator [Deltaproteobacteria bacterium]
MEVGLENIRYPYRIRLPEYMGRAIKDVRKRKKMTQGDLADITGSSVKFISDVERGKPTVQMDKVFDLARALGLLLYVTPEPLSRVTKND